MSLRLIDHVRLAMPPGRENAGRRFYRDVLGFEEVEKPANLAGRAGVKLHSGVDEELRPAREAHPAFAVDGFEAIFHRCGKCGFEIAGDEPVGGGVRAFVHVPFGNRIEPIQGSAVQ